MDLGTARNGPRIGLGDAAGFSMWLLGFAEFCLLDTVEDLGVTDDGA